MITEDIIRNFFEGRCDAREVAIVDAWLRDNPAKLQEYIGADDWEDFQPGAALSPDTTGKLWDAIDKNTTAPLPWRRWIAVAASILLVIGLSLYVVLPTKTMQVANTTAQTKTVTLSDGSRVDLSPNSTLSYAKDFGTATRAVTLNGEATFTIAKDAGRPFTVYSDSVLVTVLGTCFTVKSSEVMLHEGKVVVTAARKEYYLTPGDVFVDRRTNTPVPRVLHLTRDKDNSYVFNDYPLDVVFDQLQVIYHTKILYNRTDLGNRTFIGKTDGTDSLSHILRSIALLNNFSLRRQEDGFVIGSAPY